MIKPKLTPGNWKIGSVYKEPGCHIVTDKNYYVALVGKKDCEYVEADAKFLAASKGMLYAHAEASKIASNILSLIDMGAISGVRNLVIEIKDIADKQVKTASGCTTDELTN